MTHDYDLVIADAHTHPEDDFSRFDWLGRMILEERPRAVISIGDFGSLDSMSGWDDIKVTTFRQDVAAMVEAQRRVFAPIDEWSARQRSHKHAPHVMERIKIKGNHEERADRAKKKDPYGFSTVVDFDDIVAYTQYWDSVYEYGEIVNIGGIHYTHCMMGNTGRPLSLSTVAKHTSNHLIQGHQHSLQFITVPVPGGVRMVMSAPAFMHDGYVPPYAKRSTRGWTYGILKVRPESPVEAPGVEYVSIKELERQYG